jgi:hypothetical protein
MMEHVRLTHENCERSHCAICDGGLFLCAVCGQAEGELEPTCPGRREGAMWRDISTAPWDVPVLLYAPPEALFENPHGYSGEYRVSTRKNWTWATKWMPLKEPT